MTTENKTQPTDGSVQDFITALGDERVISDCLQLIEMMRTISAHEPVMWGPSIIGFDSYHYKYASGREGDAPVIAFSPRKGKLTVYIEESVQGSELFSSLGTYATSKVCIYIKRLSDIDVNVLSRIIKASYQHTKSLQQDEHQ